MPDPSTLPESSYALNPSITADLVWFAPELLLVLGCLLALLTRLVKPLARWHVNPMLACIVGLALALLGWQWSAWWDASSGATLFSGLLSVDHFSLALRGFLLVFALLGLLLGWFTGLPDADDSADYAVLFLGSTLGLMLLVASNHLIVVFVGLEMASLPSYALAGFLKGKRSGSEAALKYILYGSAASGVALFGVSLLTIATGTAQLPLLAQELAAQTMAGELGLTQTIGLFLLFVGFGYKLAVVPFHFWLPDVFAGAAAEVGAFLSIASKAGAVGVLVRFTLALHQPMQAQYPLWWPQTLGLVLLCIAALTMTFGNLAALMQKDLKRLLGYSTIAHAGVMLLAISTFNSTGASAVLYYLAGYLPANLVAFAVVAVLRNRTGKEDDSVLVGLLQREPVLAFCLGIALLSLLGLPPLAGFAGKFQVFEALYRTQANNHALGAVALARVGYIVLGIAVLNTVLSAGYYLRLVKLMVLDESPEPVATANRGSIGIILLLTVGVVLLVFLGVAWAPLLTLTTAAGQSLGGTP